MVAAMQNSFQPVYILGAKRTPMGGLQGALSACTAPQLGAAAIAAAIRQAGIDTNAIQAVTMGCVLPAGLGQAPARQAALGADLAVAVPCATVNKMCGSGMYSAILAQDAIAAGSAQCVIAGGMESMSNAPYLLASARAGQRLGHKTLHDSMFLDGLEDAYEGKLMGCYAQDTADSYGYSRDAMDDFAKTSLKRARQAGQAGYFADETTPVVIPSKKGDRSVAEDEQPQNACLDKISKLRPAFRSDGTVTAANSSSISDGAASLVIASGDFVQERAVKPLATLKTHATHAQKPEEFTLAPIGAIRKLLDKVGWSVSSVDLFEINEAFAVVTMVCAKQIGVDLSRVNIAGGACALGHPIGASGARIMATLIHQMRRLGLRRGVAALCIGGGEATAVAIEIEDYS